MNDGKGKRAHTDPFGVLSALGPLVFSVLCLPLGPSLPLDRKGPLAHLPNLSIPIPLPLGSLTSRGLLVRPLLAAVLGYSIYRVTRALAHRQGGRSSLDGWLAFAAALYVGFSAQTLNVLFENEAAFVSAVIAFLSIARVLGRRRFDGYLPAVSCGLVVLASGFPLALLRGSFEGYFRVPLLSGSTGFSFALGRSPILGVFSLVALAFGSFVHGRTKTRQGLVPLVLLVLLGLGGVGSGDASGHATVELCASIALTVLAMLGIRATAEAFAIADVFGARALATMLTILSLALGLGELDRTYSKHKLDDARLARDTMDLLFEGIPDGSLVFARDPALGAALVSLTRSGERPDLLVLTERDLLSPGALGRLLTKHPELTDLVRELHVTLEPSEEALCHLADGRPVFVEPNPAWSTSLLAHLEPGLFLSRYRAHPVARSDRAAGLRAAEERAKLLGSRLDGDSRATSLALRLQVTQAVALKVLGDSDSSQASLRALFPAPPAPAIETEGPAVGRGLALSRN